MATSAPLRIVSWNVERLASHLGPQPARGSLLDRVERIAGGRLLNLREKVIGIAAEDIREEAGAALDLLKGSHRQAQRRSRNLHPRIAEGRRMAAADDTADCAFAADGRDLDGAPVAHRDDHRDHRGAEGKIAPFDIFATSLDPVADFQPVLCDGSAWWDAFEPALCGICVGKRGWQVLCGGMLGGETHSASVL